MLTETEMKNRESLAMAIECIIRHHRFTTEQAIMDDPKFDPLKRSMPRELATAADLINVVLTNLERESYG
mgnify:CR=1 FL=1